MLTRVLLPTPVLPKMARLKRPISSALSFHALENAFPNQSSAGVAMGQDWQVPATPTTERRGQREAPAGMSASCWTMSLDALFGVAEEHVGVVAEEQRVLHAGVARRPWALGTR